MKILLEECIKALGGEANILNDSQGDLISDTLNDKFHFGSHGVNLTKYKNAIPLGSIHDVDEAIRNTSCFIIWDEYSLPVVKSNISIIWENIDDVTAVSFDTYIFDVDFNWLIEFHHEGKITLVYNEISDEV